MTELAKGPSATAKDKDPSGGLSAAGRKKFGVKKGVVNYSGAGEEDKKRWVRWALRFTKTPRPLKDDKGNPTRYALMFHAWGEPVPTSAAGVKSVHSKAVARAKSLKMGQYAEKAEAFFFEHDWEPVEGHPAITTCDLCGLNRWSDEHQGAEAALYPNPGKPVPPQTKQDFADPGYMKDGKTRYLIATAEQVRAAWAYINLSGTARSYTPGERAKIKLRIIRAARRLQVDLGAEQAAVLSRLEKNYGPMRAAKPTNHDGLADLPPLGPSIGGIPPRQLEDQTIADNALTPAALAPHPFMEAEFHNADDQPRCRLCGDEQAAHKVFEPEIPVAAADEPAVRATLTATPSRPITADLRPEAPLLGEGEALPAADDTVKAFVTEVNGRTLITAPASAFTTEAEKALHANEHFLWMQGRFVGAEKANRNGAFWSTDDLELGELTVRHGPLNWLHEARHVIGTIASTKMVKRNEQTAQDLDQPHIEALSAVWRWIYPDEAWVIEQASDAGKLWYSMECISKEVACVGDGGCGARASYGEYMQGKGGTCDHMRTKSATRHFASPTFLGGAVIVPPVRPGWAEADASVMRQAAKLAEHAFEQAGAPDVAASEWEQLMAQLVRYAAH